MSRLLLYMAPASPPSRSVMMLGELLGLRLQCQLVNLLKMEHKTPEYRKINPLGLVPVLQDGDFILCDSHAILKYLVTAYGGDHQEALYPRDLKARAVVDQRLFFNASFFFRKLINDIAFPAFQGKLKAPTQRHIDNIEEAYAVLDGYLQKSLFVAADRLTIADLSVGATATAAQVVHRIDPKRQVLDGYLQKSLFVAADRLTIAVLSVEATATAAQVVHRIDPKRYPHGAEWLARLQKDPVFQKVNAPGVELLGKILNKFWKQNNAA